MKLPCEESHEIPKDRVRQDGGELWTFDKYILRKML